MGFLRAIVVALALTVVFATSVRADDYGPHRGIREVRTAIPILMHAAVAAYSKARPVIVVTDVVVVGDDAIARWADGGLSGVVRLSYRNATWWIVRSLALPLCDDTRGDLVTPAAIEPVVRRHIDLRRQSCADAGLLSYMPSIGPINVSNDDGYMALWAANTPFELSNIHGRAPSDAEMSGPGANSIFYIYASGGPGATTFPASTLTVWCPFVLDPSVHYIIEFSGADGRLGPIRGTLNDNTLTFEIPAFTAPANADLRGEVDYLPYRER